MLSLKQKAKEIKSGKLKAVENVMNFSEKIATKKVKDLNIFLNLNENAIEEAKKIDERIKKKESVGKLAGLCFAVKANIAVKGLETNCASKVLEGYVSGYNATVIERLKAEDAIILGIVNMDEFASGASGETSAFGPTKNPKNPKLIPGGSSSGPAAAVAAELCDFSLGTDTGGSIRNPASHCGIVGLKPTYGSVSRYGLLDLTMSTDVIGPLTNSSEDSKFVFDIMKGQDNFDATTSDSKTVKVKKKYTVGLVDVGDFAEKEIVEKIEKDVEKIAKNSGWDIKKVNLPLDISLETYYILTYVEFFSATRKYDGRRFGFKIDEKGGPEVQRRIIGGSEISKEEFSGQYYQKALRARNFLKEKFDKLFSDVDVLILPTVPKLAHEIGSEISVKDMYLYDVLTVPISISGVPAISIPTGTINDKELGMQIAADKFNEDLIFDVAKKF